MLPGGAGNIAHSSMAEILQYQYGSTTARSIMAEVLKYQNNSNTAHSIMATILQYQYGSRLQYRSKVKEHLDYNRLTIDLQYNTID